MVFRSSIARPTDTPIYASTSTSRCSLQDSGPRWIRFSFLVGLFHSQQHAGLSRRTYDNPVFRPQFRVRGWLLVENSTVEIFGAASLGVHSAFHPGPKPLETGAAGPVLYWLPGASALNR